MSGKTPAWFTRSEVRFAGFSMESREFAQGNADALFGEGYQGHKYQHDTQRWLDYSAGYDMGLDGEAAGPI